MYEKLIKTVTNLGSPKVMLVGDFMLDIYTYGDAVRISPEAPVPILKIKKTEYSTYWESSEEYLNIFYQNLLPKTAKHKASMLRDIKEGKRTEIDALNGAVVKLGKKFDIDVVHNVFIVNMIKFLESR